MPLIKYVCTKSDCNSVSSKMYRNSQDISNKIVCNKCGEESKRMLSSPASSSKIVVDNGLQARAVEIDPNIMEINSERARKPENRGN